MHICQIDDFCWKQILNILFDRAQEAPKMWNRRYRKEVPAARAPPWRDPGRACCTYGPRVLDTEATRARKKPDTNRSCLLRMEHLWGSGAVCVHFLTRARPVEFPFVGSGGAGTGLNLRHFCLAHPVLQAWNSANSVIPARQSTCFRARRKCYRARVFGQTKKSPCPISAQTFEGPN